MSGKEYYQDLVSIESKLDDFVKRFNDNLQAKSEVIKEKEKITALESKLKVEKKINSDLWQKMKSMAKHKEDIETICSQLKTNLNIKDSDENRLIKAKEMIRIGKQYTGIRWDYSAPLTQCKGYVKNNRSRTLECFNFNTEEDTAVVEKMWACIQAGSGEQWDHLGCYDFNDKENLIHNR